RERTRTRGGRRVPTRRPHPSWEGRTQQPERRRSFGVDERELSRRRPFQIAGLPQRLTEPQQGVWRWDSAGEPWGAVDRPVRHPRRKLRAEREEHADQVSRAIEDRNLAEAIDRHGQ